MNNREILKELLDEDAFLAYENIKKIISELDNVGSSENIPKLGEFEHHPKEEVEIVLQKFSGIIIEANKVLSKLMEFE